MSNKFFYDAEVLCECASGVKLGSCHMAVVLWKRKSSPSKSLMVLTEELNDLEGMKMCFAMLILMDASGKGVNEDFPDG